MKSVLVKGHHLDVLLKGKESYASLGPHKAELMSYSSIKESSPEGNMSRGERA